MVISFSKDLILNCFDVWETAMESSPELEPETIQGRLRKFMATLKDPDTLEILEDTIATIECLRYRPRIVPERRLSSTRVCR